VKHPPYHLRAIGFALLGYTFWVVADSCLKILTATSMPKPEILLFLNIGSVLTVIAIANLRGRTKFLRPRKPFLCATLGILQFVNMICFLFALQRLSLTTAYIIVFTGPIMTAILASLFLHEHVGWIKALMTVVGFGGVIVALDPVRLIAGQGDWLGYLAAFVAVILYTIYMLLLRFHGDAENPEAAVMYPRILVGTLCSLGFLLWPFEVPTFKTLYTILPAGISAAVGWMLVTIASQKAPAATVAPYRYSQIITGGIAGYFIWNDRPTLNLVIGALIIILSSLYIARHTQHGMEMLEQQET
jgi:drug/metabolite transporter (DMT)-like permease